MLYDTNICIDDIDVTMPKVDIYFVKVIDTKKGVSLEGQYLSGKNLLYSEIIINISDDVITKVFVQDDIPKETRFIENYVVVNNISKGGLNPQDCFRIVDIKAKEKIIIKFKALVLPQYGGDEIIKNYSSIEYDYLYNIKKRKIE